MPQEVAPVVSERAKPNIIQVKFDMPLVMNVIFRGAHNVKQVEE